jgi:purine nucleosidase
MNESYNEAWWVDCDPGTDDIMAIAIAIAKKKNIVGITVTNGNTTAHQCANNLAKALEFMESKIPIYIGSQAPIIDKETFGTDGFFGPDAMGGVESIMKMTGWVELIQKEDGFTALIKASKQAKENNQKFIIVALAPLSTLAVAALLDPELPKRVDELWIMGGSMSGHGFTNLSTEFNFDRDPEGAHVVLRDYKNITVLPIEVEEDGCMTQEETVAYRMHNGKFAEFMRTISRRVCADKSDEKGNFRIL